MVRKDRTGGTEPAATGVRSPGGAARGPESIGGIPAAVYEEARAALTLRDPRLGVAYQHFRRLGGGLYSPTQLCTSLRLRGHNRWVPTRKTAREWIDTMFAAEREQAQKLGLEAPTAGTRRQSG